MSVPMIFDVRRGSTEDGPGIRTAVFFKGCNLRCVWCHNPESIDPNEEIGFYVQNCIACSDCEKACPFSACRVEDPLRINRDLCNGCGACADICPAKALRRIGRSYAPEELMERLLMDEPFYRASGGGVTLSGGEPTLHMEYAGEILRRLKQQAVHTTIETNGFFAWDRFRDTILPHVDLIMMDVKLVDPVKHRAYTGVSNEVIIENLRRLAREHPSRLLARVPLIPGFTATTENLGEIAALFQSLGLESRALLPYNPTWFHKAAAIGSTVDPRLLTRMPSREELDACRACFTGSRSSTPSARATGIHTGEAATEKEKSNEKSNIVRTGSEKVHRVQARRA
jgi:pyruvate formate lyase activating enzyme